MPNVFVGEGRKALVSGIIERLDNLTDYKGDSRASLISLEAPSGWGKTRIIQEVYKQITERQSSPYWPMSIIAEDEDDPVSRRKHLVPSFVDAARDKKVLPEFFWWGLTCDMRSTNMLSRTLMEDIEQLRFHAPYLEAAWAASKLTGLGKYATIAKAKSALGAVFEEGTVTGLSKLAELGLGATPFGIGLGLKLVTSGVKAAKASKDKNDMMQLGFEAHQSADENLVDETIHLFSRLAHKDLPIIICVEDIHKATSPVLELIAKLVARNAPILILTTTWPGEFEKIKELNDLLSVGWAQERIIRMEYDKPTPKGLPEEASLSQLPAKDLSKIILARFPKAEDKAVNLLTDRYKNPLPLELVLNMKSLKLDYPYLELDNEDVENLPETVRDLYNSLWNELPEPVQQLLALSTELMPEDQPEWLMSLITDATRQLVDEEWAKEISQIAANDNVPHGWARVVEGWLRRFGEANQLDIARAHVKELFGKRQLRQFNEAIAGAINRFDFENSKVNDVEATHKAWLAISLYDSGDITDDIYLDSITLIGKNLIENPFHETSLSEIGNLTRLADKIEIVQTKPLIALKSIQISIHEAKYRYYCGAYESAKELFDSLIAVYKKIANTTPNTDDFLIVANGIKVWNTKCLIELGEYVDAADYLNQVLQIIPSDFSDNLEFRVQQIHLHAQLNLAKAKAGLNKTRAALKILDVLVYDAEKTYGNGGKFTLEVREFRAQQIVIVGDLEAAKQEYEILIPLMYELYGDNEGLTILTKANYQTLIHAKYDIGAAINNLVELYDHVWEEFGYGILFVKVNESLAEVLEEANLTENAIKKRKDIHAFYEGYHWNKLPKYRENLKKITSLLWSLNQYNEAIEQYKILVDNNIQIFGETNIVTLKSKENLAGYMKSNNQLEEASTIYKSLVGNYTDILGKDHSNTLTSQFLLAKTLHQNSNLNEAKVIYEDLLAKQIATLGEDDLNTVNTRHNLAYTLGLLDEPSQAKNLFLENIPYQTQLYGENHEQTLSANYLFNMLLLDENPNKENALRFNRLIDRIELHLGASSQLAIIGKQVLDEIIEPE